MHYGTLSDSAKGVSRQRGRRAARLSRWHSLSHAGIAIRGAGRPYLRPQVATGSYTGFERRRTLEVIARAYVAFLGIVGVISITLLAYEMYLVVALLVTSALAGVAVLLRCLSQRVR